MWFSGLQKQFCSTPQSSLSDEAQAQIPQFIYRAGRWCSYRRCVSGALMSVDSLLSKTTTNTYNFTHTKPPFFENSHMLLLKFNLNLGFVLVNFFFHYPHMDFGLKMLLLGIRRLLLLFLTWRCETLQNWVLGIHANFHCHGMAVSRNSWKWASLFKWKCSITCWRYDSCSQRFSV